MEGSSIMGMAGGFIGLAILLGIGTMILGGSATDCSTLVGAPEVGGATGNDAGDAKQLAANPNAYNSQASAFGTLNQPAFNGYDSSKGTGHYGLTGSWAHSCSLASAQAQSGYTLMLVALVITAAAVVLIVVRMLAA